MIRNFLIDVTTSGLAKALDAAGLRHRVISDNIANVETPGFTRSEVSFEDQLKRAFDSTDEDSAIKRIQEAQPEARADALSPARPDGNNVSIDKEMAELTKNTLRYEALVRLLNLKGLMVREAITEGKR
jgi:flagellar basal-body rod protein FlgB